ncbi:MAG: hypothetical protein QXD60_03865 [Nanopusillaceae archaeon]
MPTQYLLDYVIHAGFRLLNNFSNPAYAILNMYMIVYQNINGSVYEFVTSGLTDMFLVHPLSDFRGRSHASFPQYFFMYFGQMTRKIGVSKFTVYIRQLNKSEFQGVVIHTLGHHRASLRVAIDYYRCDIANYTHSGLNFIHSGRYDLLLSLGGEPIGIGITDTFTIKNARDPYLTISGWDSYCQKYIDVQQSFYIMYNPGDWLVARERYSVYNRTLGRSVEWLRFALIELPRQCPTMLWVPANRSAYTENPRRYVAETSNNTKLRPLLFVRNATWVPLDSSSYYVVAVAYDWGGARQITYAGYGGVLVGNGSRVYTIYEYKDCRLVRVFNARGDELARRAGAKRFVDWAVERGMAWVVPYVGGTLERPPINITTNHDPQIIAVQADSYARTNIASYAAMFAVTTQQTEGAHGGSVTVNIDLRMPPVMANIPSDLLSIVIPATMALAAGLFAARRYEDPDEIILISAVTGTIFTIGLAAAINNAAMLSFVLIYFAAAVYAVARKRARMR